MVKGVSMELGKISIKEKIQFVLDREHGLFLDTLILAFRRATGQKLERSEIMRVLIDILRDDRPILSGIKSGKDLRKLIEEYLSKTKESKAEKKKIKI